MGFLDKMKDAAGKAADQAKHATNVGKEKLEDVRLKKKIDEQCEQIGQLVVAQKRNEAPADVEAQIDAKVAEIAELEKQLDANNVASGDTTSQPAALAVPEGDTIHNAARRLREALTGHEITRFELRRNPRGLRPPAAGAHITSVDARGKHLLMEFDDGASLHTHMQLTGAWHVYAPGERWRRPAHRARVVLEVDDGTTAVCFDAPVVELRRHDRQTPSTRARRALEHLGPDLSVPEPDLDAALGHVAALDPNTEIASALLDQRIASGIGNVFKSEICWACRVHPLTTIAQLDPSARRELYETAHRLLRANLDTTRRVTYGRGLAVYGRARRPCPRCRTAITMMRQGDPPRSTYWCPRCQPDPTTRLR